jgi:hypothetical protein
LCNPVKVFDAIVKKANNDPEIEIKLLVKPDTDRGILVPEPMPTSLLYLDELRILSKPENESTIAVQLQKGKSFDNFVAIHTPQIGVAITSKTSIDKEMKEMLKDSLPYIDERTRDLLPLRDTDKIAEEKKPYSRR